jgi:hypothetical protein
MFSIGISSFPIEKNITDGRITDADNFPYIWPP